MAEEESHGSSSSDKGKPAPIYFSDSKQTPINLDYAINDTLGDGGFSVVKKGVRLSDGAEVAIKIIRKQKVGPDDLEREVSIWKEAAAASKRVVQLFEIYEDSKTVHLVMELMSGGELFEKIVEMDDYSERYASTIIKQVFMIIRDLHRVHIVHQDLKPENLLLVSTDNNAVKLCDFGLAEIAEDDVELVGIVGSTTYMAPEVVAESGHSKPVDIYAAGVIMYILLCGYPPFEPENGITELEFPEPEWDEISEAAKDLITKLLSSDPDKRPTPDEALKHRWFDDVETVREPKPLYATLRTLRKYRDMKTTGDPTSSLRGQNRGGRQSVFGVFAEVPTPLESPVVGTTLEKKEESIKKEQNGSKKSPQLETKHDHSSLKSTEKTTPSEKEMLLMALKGVDNNTQKTSSAASSLSSATRPKRKSNKKLEQVKVVNKAVTESITTLYKLLETHKERNETLSKQLMELKTTLAAETARREAVEKRLTWEINMIKKTNEEESKKRKKSATLSKQDKPNSKLHQSRPSTSH